MRHRNKKQKLGVNAAHRKSLIKNLFTSLLACEKIQTTEARGRELVRISNSLIEKAKKGDLPSRRKVSSYITNKKVSITFFKDTLPKLASRKSGHLRLLKMGTRKGDGAKLVLVELITEDSKQKTDDRKQSAEDAKSL